MIILTDKTNPWDDDGQHYCCTFEGDGKSLFILSSPDLNEANMVVFVAKDKQAARTLADELRRVALTFEQLLKFEADGTKSKS